MTKLWLSYRTTNLWRFMIIIIFFENMVIDAFLACLFNVHYLIFLYMVHEYAYFIFYEYIWKSVYYFCVWGLLEVRSQKFAGIIFALRNKWHRKVFNCDVTYMSKMLKCDISLMLRWCICFKLEMFRVIWII